MIVDLYDPHGGAARGSPYPLPPKTLEVLQSLDGKRMEDREAADQIQQSMPGSMASIREGCIVLTDNPNGYPRTCWLAIRYKRVPKPEPPEDALEIDCSDNQSDVVDKVNECLRSCGLRFVVFDESEYKDYEVYVLEEVEDS